MIISDLHVHSRFSRATSKAIDIPNLEKWARIKGLDLLGTADFQHPLWSKELDVLEEREGILYTKTNFPFIWQTEISLMYSQGGKGRRIHHVILAPNKDVVKQITSFLGSKGRLDYDGRPIFGFTSIELVDAMLDISKDIEIIPAHVWTPWFGLLGSKSGFDTAEECFEDRTKYIHALETGLSSDPGMNWRLSALDKFQLVSFSDLHSFWPWRIGREATAFDCDLSYQNILKAIRTGEGLSSTIEVDPNYGKYHFDGHRNCNVRLSPKESAKVGNICPKCGKPLTVGVMSRVDELADREEGFKPENAKPFNRLIPLSELICTAKGINGLYAKKVWEVYNKMIEFYKSEFNILLNVPFNDLKKVVDDKLAELIIRNREGKIKILPGYDGEYGELTLEKEDQQSLTGFS